MVSRSYPTGTAALVAMSAAALAVSLVSLELATVRLSDPPSDLSAPLSASPERSADNERLGIVWRGR